MSVATINALTITCVAASCSAGFSPASSDINTVNTPSKSSSPKRAKSDFDAPQTAETKSNSERPPPSVADNDCRNDSSCGKGAISLMSARARSVIFTVGCPPA